MVTLYPGVNKEKRWTIADVDKLIGEHARMGIYMIGDFWAYYCVFYMISTFLVQKNRMSQAEKSRLFIKCLSTEFWHKIFTCLSIKEPDHDPDNFWLLEDVRKAREYGLNGMNLPVVMCLAWLKAMSQAKLSPFRPGQAGPLVMAQYWLWPSSR